MHVDRSPLLSALAHMRGLADISLPTKGKMRKVVHRSEFNSCGENSSAATTYTGISMRSLSELPRMSYETKESILGAASCASCPKSARMQKNIQEKGHPFSFQEVKPISFWQTIMSDHEVTHIVDFTPGSGALAVAASGAMKYEGIAVNDAHRDWLDSILDKCAMYKAGHNKGYAEKLGGGDREFVEKASMYFSGTMMEARRLLERDPAEDEWPEGEVSDSS